MGRWGDGEMGRWGDGEMGRWGRFLLRVIIAILNHCQPCKARVGETPAGRRCIACQITGLLKN
ncbi:MAG: hypothetical protein F6J90_01975 [Moorea sp. SIOASIH]|uniref:hypothetical protein n=1 Tax=Moorena sp. SIOASIH TaxID=2607817 RepID=UPI0013B73E5E|nr:hypothetical protein [Moorena sp. SIOASIH]NEO35137.1 hypothetical protein [Moorena sp. SIOASIH]